MGGTEKVDCRGARVLRVKALDGFGYRIVIVPLGFEAKYSIRLLAMLPQSTSTTTKYLLRSYVIRSARAH